VTGLDRILWVAAIAAAVGAVLSAALLRTRGVSSEPGLSTAPGEREPPRRAA
jgi:hypothetical protein